MRIPIVVKRRKDKRDLAGLLRKVNDVRDTCLKTWGFSPPANKICKRCKKNDFHTFFMILWSFVLILYEWSTYIIIYKYDSVLQCIVPHKTSHSTQSNPCSQSSSLPSLFALITQLLNLKPINLLFYFLFWSKQYYLFNFVRQIASNSSRSH